MLLLMSKDELCATKVNGFQCKLLPQRAPSCLLQTLWSHLMAVLGKKQFSVGGSNHLI